MSEIQSAKTDPKDLFWGTAEDMRFGMLGIDGTDQHYQPMTHFVDREDGALWFITSRETDLARSIGQGELSHVNASARTAHFIIVSKGQDVQICAKGSLVTNDSDAKRDELWNPVAGAWFEDKHDPRMVLLKFTVEEAAIWASTDSTFAFAWEIAKAHAKDDTPDVGTHTVVNF